MKLKLFITIVFFSVLPALAQGEANNWFFGHFGGVKFFPDGSVAPLSGSQMKTNEGCSSISDADGNLLFYTDGRNVWDRNHVLMPNANYTAGTGLLGDPSSTQSGIIVPKKNNPDIYYIFTVDEPHHQNAAVYPNQFTGIYQEAASSTGTVPQDDDGFNNGLNYSIVDLSITGANGSIGDVTTRNVHLVTYDPAVIDEAKYKCSEKITAVKNAEGTGYWVVTHFIDKFYAFAVDINGVNTVPVITQLNPVVPVSGYRRNSIGCIKVSPDGAKLAIAHSQRGTVTGASTTTGAIFLYDFDDASGVLSNPVQVAINVNAYGVEFSPQGKKLYTSYSTNNGVAIQGFVNQYNLESINIPGSGTVIASGLEGATTLQLGPNGKIYRAINGQPFLDVINNPEDDGFTCGFVNAGQSIAGANSVFGLPPFITSLFSANIIANNNCEGQPTQFELHVNGTFDSVIWNFGDGTPTSTEVAPVHTYAAAGSYTASATITREGETTEITSDITIAVIPVANVANPLTGCDPDDDGFTTFSLDDNTAAILGTQSSAQYDVSYFTSQAEADANTAPLNSTSYTNTSNPQTIFARIFNKASTDCYATTSFQISVSNAPDLLNNTFAICDDSADGDDTNGRANFDLNAVALELVQDNANYSTTFYASETDAQNQVNPLPALFANTTTNEQVVYARIVNNAAAVCTAILPVTLRVIALPVKVPNAKLVQCDTGISADGLTAFNLNEADALLSAGNATGDVTIEYYLTPADAAIGTPLPSAYTNSSNPQIITAKVTNTQTACSRLIDLTLQVNTGTIVPIDLERCDDDGTEDGRAEFDLLLANMEGSADSVTYYAILNDALLEQNPITTVFTNTIMNVQTVYARLENAGNDCVGLQEIRLIVRPLPNIEPEDTAFVCLNTGAFITLDAGLTGSAAGYSFLWSTGQTTRTILVNQPGVYTVEVTNNNNISACSRVRTITVTASNIATINNIEITDLADNNTVTVFASPTGNVNTVYLYSLDRPDGPFQESNFFENVAPGSHTVYVYDTQGCGIVPEEISVLQIPKFFTPNGDGINDTWDIVGVNNEFYRNTIIEIYDRYGKLLATVDPKGSGWTGNYNGHRLPSTDYWYVVKLENGRIVKGHFSMIR